jgi:hypothetical protein
MRLVALALLVLVVGCASTSPPRKPSPYRYSTGAPTPVRGAHLKELM